MTIHRDAYGVPHVRAATVFRPATVRAAIAADRPTKSACSATACWWPLARRTGIG